MHISDGKKNVERWNYFSRNSCYVEQHTRVKNCTTPVLPGAKETPVQIDASLPYTCRCRKWKKVLLLLFPHCWKQPPTVPLPQKPRSYEPRATSALPDNLYRVPVLVSPCAPVESDFHMHYLESHVKAHTNLVCVCGVLAPGPLVFATGRMLCVYACAFRCQVS